MKNMVYCGFLSVCFALFACSDKSQSGQGTGPTATCGCSHDQESCPGCPGEPDICVAKGSSCPRPLCPATSATCGGLTGATCPEGYTCVDDPSDNCDPNKGGADCAGVCQQSESVMCGGFAGLACPEGYTCVDDPSDNCDPNKGGADCAGQCQPGTTPNTEP
jgi:hypothetical protein